MSFEAMLLSCFESHLQDAFQVRFMMSCIARLGLSADVVVDMALWESHSDSQKYLRFIFRNTPSERPIAFGFTLIDTLRMSYRCII